MAKALVEVEDVDQEFRTGFWLKKVRVLQGVSLRVPEGSAFGFLGANGAGKTTLIHLLAGLRKPTAGRVRVCGFDATSLEARAKLGYLPERPYFYEHLTGTQFLELMGTLSGLSRSHVRTRIPQVLATVGLAPAKHVELRRYSKGMLQRIGIAQAILHDPPFLVLDEPMSGLDPIGRKEIRELIQSLLREGRTVFFSSHVIPDVEALCDQVAMIRGGKILGCGPIGQFLAQGPIKTEIVFKLPSPKKSETLSAELGQVGLEIDEIPQGQRCMVGGQQEVTEVLRRLIDLKVQVLWVKPLRPSLEQMMGDP